MATTSKTMIPVLLGIDEALKNGGAIRLEIPDGAKVREITPGEAQGEIAVWCEIVQDTIKVKIHTFMISQPGQWVPLDLKYHGFAAPWFVWEMPQKKKKQD